MAKKIDVNGLDHYHDKVSAMLASEYSSSKTYAVGDYCFHAGTLYECTTAITTAENWTAGHWTAAKLAEDTSALKESTNELKTAITQEYITLKSSDFTQGTWSGGSISSANNRICVKQLIPVKAGDKMKYSVASGLMIAFGTYEPSASASTDYHTWADATTEQEYTFPVDGNAFVQVKKSSEANISPSEYDGTVKIYNTIYNEIVSIEQNLNTVSSEIFYAHEISLEWVIGLMVNNTSFVTKASDKCTKPFTLYKGETVSIKTKGDGSYFFNAITKADSLDETMAGGYRAGTKIQAITNNNLTEYTYTATDDEEYIILSALNDPTSVASFSNLKVWSKIDEIEADIDVIDSHCSGILKNKSVMCFGDSLTAGSGVGIVNLVQRIANNYNMPYKGFVYDSADSNPDDVPIDFPRFTNYAKDGTCNRTKSGRTDSVLERVKRHIVSDTLIDYVLIECCINDYAQENRNKGTISDSYTAVYDTTTSIGAIEETLRYLTTLGKPIRVGGFIPWNVVWVPATWFDDYIPVFEKWGVPLFDMRKTAGFDMLHCAAHRLSYSLSSDDYSAYSNTTTYNLDDKVKYGGILYKCLADDVVGIPPTNAEYWMEVSSESSDGTHLNNIGQFVVTGKIQQFLEGI